MQCVGVECKTETENTVGNELISPETNMDQQSDMRSLSPVTDPDEDTGYKSWENNRESSEGTSPPASGLSSATSSTSDMCMPPPKSLGLLKIRKNIPKCFQKNEPSTDDDVFTESDAPVSNIWVTSTPNVEQARNLAKQKLQKAVLRKMHIFNAAHESLNWDAAEDGNTEEQCSKDFQEKHGDEEECIHELCNCQPQMNFSFAINCDETESVAHSSFSNEADIESLHSIDISLDEKVLSGDRLSQMTRTYHDIEVVTHLLEEKERDLELAARIGQTLLQKNRELTLRNEQLEEQLANALEEAFQLRHEISLKEDLLHIYADDETDSSGAPSPVKELRGLGRSAIYNHIEELQIKMKRLEGENVGLKDEREKLQSDCNAMETQEKNLVSDTFSELASLQHGLRDANYQIASITEELAQRNEESSRQQEEITRLLTQIVDMQRKQKQLALENEELQQHLAAANNTQYDLTREVQSLEDRYQEVTSMLDETREEARMLRNYPVHAGKSVPFGDSLAAELEYSVGLATEAQLLEPPLSCYNPSISINWSSPPSSVLEEGHLDSLAPQALHSEGKAIETHLEPLSNLSETSSRRILNTARFVNNLKNTSLPARLQYVTPKKQDRPIPTPLPIPGSNRAWASPLFTRASPDSTPSSGRGRLSSTPHDNHKPLNRSSMSDNHPSNLSNIFTPSKVISPQSGTPFNLQKPTSLRLQLANKKLADQMAESHDRDIDETPSSVCYNISPKSLFHPIPMSSPKFNSTTSPVVDQLQWINRTWSGRSRHGESIDAFACSDGLIEGLATPSLGRPGIPGTEDLERAIRKLTMRRENARYMEAERQQAMNSDDSFRKFCNSDGTVTPVSSFPSGGTTPPPSCPSSPKLSSRRRYSRFPKYTSLAPKLRIVKPLEGSITLNQWKYLAERDHLRSLQPRAEVPAGVITREHAAEVLSRSRDNSLTKSTDAKSISESPSQSSPIIQRKSKSLSVRSSPCPLHLSETPRPSEASESFSVGKEMRITQRDVLTSAPKKDVPGNFPVVAAVSSANTSVMLPGKVFASTKTHYTYTNSCIKNPTDELKKETPSCSHANSTQYCNTLSAFQLSTSCMTTSSSTSSYLSTVHPFLSGRPRKTEPTKTEAASKFFSENTRTCSMSLGMAQLFKEHGISKVPDQSIVNEQKEIPLPQSQRANIPDECSSKERNESAGKHNEHIVWNCSLQRPFLLPSVPAQNVMFNLHRHSEEKNPGTPPNSPLTSVPSSSSFLLNEMLARPSATDAQEEGEIEKEEEEIKEEATFSSNLLSKLAQLGLIGLQGFKSPPSSHIKSSSSSSSCTTSSTSSASSSKISIAKSATAPGSLLTDSRGQRMHSSTISEKSRFSTRKKKSSESASTDSSECGGLFMKPVQIDWGDLHGSSGALNFQNESEAGSASSASRKVRPNQCSSSLPRRIPESHVESDSSLKAGTQLEMNESNKDQVRNWHRANEGSSTSSGARSKLHLPLRETPSRSSSGNHVNAADEAKLSMTNTPKGGTQKRKMNKK